VGEGGEGKVRFRRKERRPGGVLSERGGTVDDQSLSAHLEERELSALLSRREARRAEHGRTQASNTLHQSDGRKSSGLVSIPGGKKDPAHKVERGKGRLGLQRKDVAEETCLTAR